MHSFDVISLSDGEESQPSSSFNGTVRNGNIRAKLSTKISEIDAEIAQVDAELSHLRQRKQNLLSQKQTLQNQIEAASICCKDVDDQWDHDRFDWSSRLDDALKNTFGLSSFRPLQRAVINASLSGEDVIVIMSTGAGKSLCYQLPAVVLEGLTLVVSPLISLVDDQLHHLKKLGINASALNAGTSKDEVKLVDMALADKKCPLRLLYVTPEKLAKSKRIMNKLEKAATTGILKNDVELIAIDEVHCCSQWGHDFRPDYKILNVLKRQFNGVPILGLTATATGHVLDDAKKMLDMHLEKWKLLQSMKKFGAETVKLVDMALADKKCPLRLLYVTPEKLAKSKRIMNKLEKAATTGILKNDVELIAIDEVHCCSQWGHDFRPDYKILNVLKRQFNGLPILGLTATATLHVLDDAKKMLGIEAAIVFRSGFNRPNLQDEVTPKAKNEMGEGIAEIIKTRFGGESGIVYCFSRKDCESIAQTLRENGVKASFYHAYLEPEQKIRIHEKWMAGQCQVIIATVAFGMGIDKPDVRFVIHHSIPKSVENYYQESGRAGRDGNPSTCILLYRMADIFRSVSIDFVVIFHDKAQWYALRRRVLRVVRDGGIRHGAVNCRRQSLAQYFGEEWERGWCQGACDICKKEENGEALASPVDLSSEVRLAVSVIEENLSTSSSSEGTAGRLTGAKIVDLMLKRTTRSRDFLEGAIPHMLLANLLTEDFHYTTYSIISYVVVGHAYRGWNERGEKFERVINWLPPAEQRKTAKRKHVDL